METLESVRLARMSSDLGDTIFSSLFKDLAKKMTQEAAPQVSQVIAEERTRIADALLRSLPFAAGGAALAVLVSQLAPPITALKAAGYLASVGLGGIGAWKTLSALKTAPAAPPAAAAPVSSSFKQYIDEAVKAATDEAEPRALKILQDEKAKLTEALKAGLPWAAGAGVLAVVTALFMPDLRPLKAAGYVAAIGAGTAGAWIALDRLKS